MKATLIKEKGLISPGKYAAVQVTGSSVKLKCYGEAVKSGRVVLRLSYTSYTALDDPEGLIEEIVDAINGREDICPHYLQQKRGIRKRLMSAR